MAVARRVLLRFGRLHRVVPRGDGFRWGLWQCCGGRRTSGSLPCLQLGEQRLAASLGLFVRGGLVALLCVSSLHDAESLPPEAAEAQ